ncbi:MAG TPA: condensation domain-containing protein, partial [Bryobacteraceae bacterium]|nr:condensation domain-containing protein [Bryobacteraceae bacterium]
MQLSDRLTRLSPRKQQAYHALLDRAKSRRSEVASGLLPLTRNSGRCTYPLSFAQQRFWVMEQFEPGTATYSIPCVRRLRGTVEVGILCASIQEVVRRHEILRTRIALVDGQPVQVVEPGLAVEMPFTDLRSLNAEDRQREVATRKERHERQPFDPGRGPLFRFELVRLDEKEYLLLATFHHMVMDGWSSQLFFRDLTVAYQSALRGKAESLPPLAVQYGDYAVWQRKWLQGETLESQLAYWRRQLADLRPLDLPSDRPRSAVASHRGATVHFSLSTELT